MKYGSGPDGTTYDIEKLHVYTDSYVACRSDIPDR